MCLSTIDQHKDVPDGVGYKSVVEHGRSRYNSCCGNETPYRLGKWTMAIDHGPQGIIPADDYSQYLAGFHILTNKKDALLYLSGEGDMRNEHAIYKVQYRLATCKGTQKVWGKRSARHCPCVVAQEIKLLERIT